MKVLQSKWLVEKVLQRQGLLKKGLRKRRVERA